MDLPAISCLSHLHTHTRARAQERVYCLSSTYIFCNQLKKKILLVLKSTHVEPPDHFHLNFVFFMSPFSQVFPTERHVTLRGRLAANDVMARAWGQGGHSTDPRYVIGFVLWSLAQWIDNWMSSIESR